MLFLLFWVLGIMAVPVAIDIACNGRNNILVKSYREFVTLPGVAWVFQSVKSTKAKWSK
jgi:hypothetical protein